MFIYSDGGPDHRLTFLSVNLSLIALYRKLNLDYLCAARTAPYHSYRNPVERIMSIVNLGSQSVALARRLMPDEMEVEAAKCNSLKALRIVAERNPEFHDASLDCIAPVKKVLTDIALRLELKEDKFSVFNAASTFQMDEFWTVLLALDKEFKLSHRDKVSAKNLTPTLTAFITHCCKQWHYTAKTIL